MYCLIINVLDSMVRIQSKYHRIGIYEIDKVSLTCFDSHSFQSNQDSFFVNL